MPRSAEPAATVTSLPILTSARAIRECRTQNRNLLVVLKDSHSPELIFRIFLYSVI